MPACFYVFGLVALLDVGFFFSLFCRFYNRDEAWLAVYFNINVVLSISTELIFLTVDR